MTESMNTILKVTSAESSFSNRLAAKHNLIIADMMDTALEESQHLDIDLTLTWCINPKNSPANVYGF